MCKVMQCVDKAMSKLMIAIEGEDEKRTPKMAAARRLWAAILAEAMKYGGDDVGIIVYKSTEDWIKKHCFVPKWIKLVHHGDVTGSNELEKVRALFVIGRPLASAEVMTQTTEALFGDYIAERGYLTRAKGGKIPIVPDKAGHNTVEVDVWEHPDPRAERVRRQMTEAALIQAIGRARAGLRGPDEPLDIYLWTDVPLPELGPVEPVLWDELEAGADWLVLTISGTALENAEHAAKAYPGMFTAGSLKNARRRAQTRFGNRRAGGRGPTSSPIVDIIGNDVGHGIPVCFQYQLFGAGQKPARGFSLRGLTEIKAWLEAKLGPLVFFGPLTAQGEADDVDDEGAPGREAAE